MTFFSAIADTPPSDLESLAMKLARAYGLGEEWRDFMPLAKVAEAHFSAPKPAQEARVE